MKIIKEKWDENLTGSLIFKGDETHHTLTVKRENKTYPLVNHLSSPMIAHISATNACNLSCPYCYANDNNKNPDMSYSEYKQVIDICDSKSLLMLYWSGGEPFCNPNFIDLLQYASQKNFFQNVITNGTLLDKSTISQLKKIPHLGMGVSLNGIWDEDENSMLSLQNASELIRQGIQTRVHVVLLRADIEHLENIINRCIEHNICNIKIGYEMPIGKLSNMELSNYFTKIKSAFYNLSRLREKYKGINLQLQSDYSILDSNTSKIFTKRFSSCEAATSELFIDNDGSVYPCTLFKSVGPFYCGNILHDDFSSIWNCQVMNQLRESISQKCDNCEYICEAWCRGLVYSITGRIDACSPLCPKILSKTGS